MGDGVDLVRLIEAFVLNGLYGSFAILEIWYDGGFF